MTISCPMRGRGSQGKRFSRGKCATQPSSSAPHDGLARRSRERLREFELAGGRVIRVTRLNEIAASVRTIRPTVELSPPTSAVRVALRRWPGGGAAFLFNEGEAPYEGVATVSLAGTPIEVDLAGGVCPPAARSETFRAGQRRAPLIDGWRIHPVRLRIGQSRARFVRATPACLGNCVD